MAVAIQVFMVLSSLVLIISVLLQPSEQSGMGALGGSTETFMGKNGASTFEAKMAMVTKISASIFVALALVLLFV